MKADAVGGLKEAKGEPVNADQMEIARLKAELAKTRMERDILKKAAAYFAREPRGDTPLSSDMNKSGRLRRSAGFWL